MKVLIVGANGQIGKHLVTYMQDHPTLEAVAMIRDEAQADFFKKMNVQTVIARSEEHTSELQSRFDLVCRLLLQRSRQLFDLHSFPTRRSSDLYNIILKGEFS